MLFLSCKPFVVITTLSTGLVGVEVTSVSWLGQVFVGGPFSLLSEVRRGLPIVPVFLYIRIWSIETSKSPDIARAGIKQVKEEQK